MQQEGSEGWHLGTPASVPRVVARPWERGKRVCRKVREGEGEGSGRWGEGLLQGMQGCVRALQGGEPGSRGAERGQTGRQLSREVMKRRGLKMKRCRSRHGTSSSHNVPELAGVNGL